MEGLKARIRKCDICAARFGATKTAHTPHPVAWFSPTSRILIAGQAPGARVHNSGIPFDDRSGDRLRDWLGVDRELFYDTNSFAIVPMAFCFPGYNAAGSDLAPPKVCAQTWRDQVLDGLKDIRLTLLIGGYAQDWHLGEKQTVTQRVHNWRDLAPEIFVLPHPSWRNTGWLKRNPYFEKDVLPALRTAVAQAMEGA